MHGKPKKSDEKTFVPLRPLYTLPAGIAVGVLNEDAPQKI